MATSRQIMGGLWIMARYTKADTPEFIRAEHDQIWPGIDADAVTEEERTELESLGWFVDEDAWSRFV